jgi:tetratricopeptide (TPR) repeat protein
MDRLHRVIHEIHRRSLWQVLAIYLVGSWGALQAVQGITEAAGLPDWVPPGALILFIVGLPIVLATAFVQEGMGAGRPVRGVHGAAEAEPATAPAVAAGSALASPPIAESPHRQHFLSWRNAIVGGVVAFAVLALSVGVYTFMWTQGVGPVGSLVAAGVIDERERVVLADFGNATTDSLLGEVVTEALRVDLAESQVITLVERASVSEILQRMGRGSQEAFVPELAREAAVREGLKAVIEGEVGAAGSSFVLTARIVAAEDGAVLGSFRETAKGPDEILDAIDALSQAIRTKAGESLVTVRETGALEQVTTPSLEALRLYTQAEIVSNQGDSRRGITLLEEAIALDSAFAAAWRKLGVLLNNTNAPNERRTQAATRAYELRDRLTPRERDLATAWYFFSPGPQQNRDRSAQVYESVLETYPDDRVALNNLAVIKEQEQDFESAAGLLQQAVGGPGATSVAHDNLIRNLYQLGREEEAKAALQRFAERYPEHPRVADNGFLLAYYGHRWNEADSLMRVRLAEDRETAANSYARLAMIRVAQGRLQEAAPYFKQRGDVGAVESYGAALDQATIDILWLGDAAAARRTLSAVLARHRLQDLEPQQRNFIGLATVHARMGDTREAEGYLARHESERPQASQGDAYQGERSGVLGHLALARGEFAAAEERFRDARRLRGCAPLCYAPELGRALAKQGKNEEALRELETYTTARTLGPIFNPTVFAPLAFEWLGEVREALGQREQAAAAYEQVVQIWKDADPALQPRVQRAREKAAALRGALE